MATPKSMGDVHARNGAGSRRIYPDGLRGFRVSQTCYRYVSKTDAENEEIAKWLLRLDPLAKRETVMCRQVAELNRSIAFRKVRRIGAQ